MIAPHSGVLDQDRSQRSERREPEGLHNVYRDDHQLMAKKSPELKHSGGGGRCESKYLSCFRGKIQSETAANGCDKQIT